MGFYTERKPIYDTYKSIIDEIINKNKSKEFAEAEIESLDNSLLAAFREIRQMHLMNKKWDTEK